MPVPSCRALREESDSSRVGARDGQKPGDQVVPMSTTV